MPFQRDVWRQRRVTSGGRLRESHRRAFRDHDVAGLRDGHQISARDATLKAGAYTL
jgi:hypothetical protein